MKRAGRPGVGFVFRVEGKEAYPYALIFNGETQYIRNSSEHMKVFTFMTQLTNANALD
jgi:hypothetical protein